MKQKIFYSFYVLFSLAYIIRCSKNNSKNRLNNIDQIQVHVSPKAIPSGKPNKNPINKSLLQNIPLTKSVKQNFKLKTKNGIQQIDLLPPTNYTPTGGISGGLSHFNTLSNEQGLSLSSIACGYLDRQGNLWFGTYGGGVNKYDGKVFTVFNSSQGLANNLVLCITEDQFGNLWFGTQGGGVSKYDGKTFKTFNILDGMADNVVYSVLEDKKGNLWFGTKSGGVSKYSPPNNIYKNTKETNTQKIKLFKNYTTSEGLASNTIRTIAEDKKGNLWFGTEGEGITKYNGIEFKSYNQTDGLPNNTIWCSKVDDEGSVWFGTNGGGVCKYNGKTFQTINSTSGLSNNIVWAITEDINKKMWFATEGGGVCVYNGFINTEHSFTTYNTEHGLSNNVVFSITEDNRGNLWFGTYGGGVSRFNGNAFVTFNAKQGLASNVVFSVAEDKHKNLWFGSYGGGITKYDGKTFTKYSTSQGLANNTVWAIIKDKNENLWFGTNGDGVTKYDGKSFTNYNTSNGLPHNTIRCIKEDIKGNIWFASEGGGVTKFNDTTFVNYKTDQGLPSNVVRCIHEDKSGNIWFGTEGSGIAKFDSKSFTNINSTNGLINNVVRSIAEDQDGNLWFATQGGLSCLIHKTKTDSLHFVNFTTANGLPDNYITQVYLLKNQKIIVGTNNGIAIFNPASTLKQKNKLVELELFTVNKNYPVRDVNVGQNAIFQDHNGIIWIGTGDDKTSLVRLDYNLIRRDTKITTPQLQSIKINEQIIDWYCLKNSISSNILNDSITNAQQQITTYGKLLSNRELDSIQKQYDGIKFTSITPFYQIPENLILPYSHNSITIEFNALDLSKNFMINYQYILEGYDKNWSPILKKSEATFGNINEGDYIFKLKAQSPNGIWSEPILFKFKILPPFYRTIWAYLFYALSIFVVLKYIINWRLSASKKRQLELENIVVERTADVVKEKEVAERQKEIVQEKQKEIVDSINYAKRIQEALLSHGSYIQKNLPQHFVLFKPKDIVSGDFYWSTEHEDNFYLGVCDSTGHGVPGAFMSLLNAGFLNEAIKEKNILQPNEIFNYVRERLITSISNDGQQDGMDGILICINKKTNQITYSAANNEPVLVSKQSIIELSKDKMPIGKGEKKESFTLYTINANSGDSLYLYTDGYADQFGGPKGKKFKYKALNNMLISISHKTMIEQYTELENTLDQWRGNHEQVDDILVIGIRLTI